MRLPPLGPDGLHRRAGGWQEFKEDVNEFFADLFSPVCTKFPKTLGCPKPGNGDGNGNGGGNGNGNGGGNGNGNGGGNGNPNPGPPSDPGPPQATQNPVPTPPVQVPPGQDPPTTTIANNPAPTTPAPNPPPAATAAPTPVVPEPQPTQNPGNGNGGGDGNGDGNGDTDPGSGPNPGDSNPTRAADSGPRPTTTRATQMPQGIGGNVFLVVSETASGPRPTDIADSPPDSLDDSREENDSGEPAPDESDGSDPGELVLDDDAPSNSSPSGQGSSNDESGFGSFGGGGGGGTGDTGGTSNGSGIDGGASGGNAADSSNSGPSPLPGIIGAVVSIFVLLLILIALLYKYRRNRRVQSFLIRFTPFKIAPYSKLDRKRSSMGSELMFGCRGEEPYTDEKRPWSGNYGSIGTAHPDVLPPTPAAARHSLRSGGGGGGPPVLDTMLANSVRSASPTSEFEPSPLSPTFPNMRTPPAARHSPRSSQDTLGGISIASSGVFAPSMISWPIPPSTPGSVGSPPGTANTYDTGPIIVGRSTPTRYKPIHPAPASNWQSPPDWR